MFKGLLGEAAPLSVEAQARCRDMLARLDADDRWPLFG
jgi:hypothetical protein